MQKKFYSVKEASKILGVSTNTIYKYLDEGSLKGKRHANRGRFKIPYSEIEPYLAAEESADNIAKAPVDKKGGAKLTFFELGFGASLLGLAFIYFLWNFGRGATGSQIPKPETNNKSSLLTDIGNAALGYSGRTFSGFGSLISRVLPAQELTSGTQPPNEIVSNPLIESVSEDEIPDFNLKIQDTERLTYKLYVDVQVLSSSAQKLLGKSRTLTSAELNDATDEMSLLLGSLSDSSDQKTIYAQINWLDESWDFSTIEAAKRAASQVSYILDSLQRQSLGAFTKPELTDLNDLVSETDLLQGLVGSTSDTSTQKTLYGNIKEVEILAQALDTKTQEIDKILGSWDSYNISEKENTIKSILSDSLSLNILPKVDEVILSGLLSQGSEAELKNSLLSLKGVLEANKTYLAQEIGKPVVATWSESGGGVFKILIANPSTLASQEATIKHYLPAEIGKDRVGQIDEGLKLSFDSQRNQYYLEGSLLLGAGEIKTIGLQVNDMKQVDQKDVVAEKSLEEESPKVLGEASVDKPSDKVVAPPAQNEKTAGPVSPLVNAGQVAGVKTINYPAQSIVVWGSIVAILILALVLLGIYLKSKLGRGKKKPDQADSDDKHEVVPVVNETSILLPEVRLNPESVVVAAGPSRASFSFPRMEFRALRNGIVSIKTGLLRPLISIRRSRPNFHNIATILLVGLTSTTISAVLAFKLMSLIKAESPRVLGKEVVDQNEEIKMDGGGDESMVLVKVSGGSSVNVRQEATTSSKIVAKIKYTKLLSKVSEEGNWTEIATGPDPASGIKEPLTGWVSSELIETSAGEINGVLESTQALKGKKITIKETETGWLRVRSLPWGGEIGKVYPGETYELLDKKGDWFLLELPDGQKGWVSSRYAYYE